MSTIALKLDKIDRVFHPNDKIKGQVVIHATNPWSHQGISMKVHGSIRLQMNDKSLGIFDAFSNSIKPMELMYYHIPICSAGKAVVGVNTFPFEFELCGIDNQQLFETYHGVYISVTYEISCDVTRGIMKKKLSSSLEFVVEVPLKEPLGECPESFIVTPESLENVRTSNVAKLPEFRISGKVYRTNCLINLPFTGEITIEESSSPVKSIEVQLIRVESIQHIEGTTREATEIQNVQIALGDVCHNLSIPIYMIFPRLFSCPTMITKGFRVEFEVNVVVLFTNGYMITENFPIHLYRRQ